jgi:hypothetical protein
VNQNKSHKKNHNFDFWNLPEEVLTECTKSGLPEELGNEAMTLHLVYPLVFDGSSPLGNGAASSCPAEVVIKGKSKRHYR